MAVSIEVDNAVPVNFLKRWSPNGPWAITSIRLDRKEVETKSFGPDTADELLKFLKKHNGKSNIYYSINTPMRMVDKKTGKNDILSVDWLHVDVDPRAGEDLVTEQNRIRGLFTDNLPKGVPPPTVLVFSGGGYQAFWKLSEPVKINGSLEAAEEVERYNQQLEAVFGADACHNVDRIMRLPGTVNVPDEKKKKKGRVPTLATLEFWEESRVYPLTEFIQAPVLQGTGTGFETSLVQVSGNIKRIEVEDLDQWEVPDRVRVVLVQGRDHENPKPKDNSRSAWVFDACCNLVRCGLPDDVIYSILTDPDFGISESVLEAGAGAQKYALRQIERAKEEVINPNLRSLNDQFAVIGNIGGKCRIIEEVHDYALDRPRITRQSFEDFNNRFLNKTVEIGKTKEGMPLTQPLGKWWLRQPGRRYYDTLAFAPGKHIPGAYNLWRGFACQAKPGDCSLFLGHIKENLCQNSSLLYDYVIGWMARAVQHPDTPGYTAIVLRGGQGVGKSVFAKVFGSLFGRHFLHVSNPSHLVGNFNSHLRDTVVLFADEAFYAQDKRHTSVLKTLVTEETLVIESKGIDVEPSPNYVHLIMASNDRHVIPAGRDERRFLVLDVGHAHKQDSAYFKALLDQMEKQGGREALLYMLMEHDLSNFDVRKIPATKALMEQKIYSMSPEEEWWFQKLAEGRIFPHEDEWNSQVSKEDLVEDYVQYTNKYQNGKRRNAIILGRFLKTMCPTLRSFQKTRTFKYTTRLGQTIEKTGRGYFYEFEPLKRCRAYWEEHFGPTEWSREAVEGHEKAIQQEAF